MFELSEMRFIGFLPSWKSSINNKMKKNKMIIKLKKNLKRLSVFR